MRWVKPFIAHGAALLEEEDLSRTGKAYHAWLRQLADRSARARAA
jgi:hypothetical protein